MFKSQLVNQFKINNNSKCFNSNKNWLNNLQMQLKPNHFFNKHLTITF